MRDYSSASSQPLDFMTIYSVILWITPVQQEITDDQDLSVCRLSRFSQDHREGGLPD
jgi:hypothetical protein